MNELKINDSVYTGVQYDSIMSSTQYIKNDLHDMSKSFCKLGFHLWELKYNGFRVIENVKYTVMEHNFYDYVNEYFGISKTTCNNLIRVCQLYSYGDRMHVNLDEKYAAYTFSQLVEMSSMSYDLRKKINPNMTIREIRQIKKENEIVIEDKKSDVGSKNKNFRRKLFINEYCIKTNRLLEDDLMLCLKNSVKNVDKVKNIINLLQNYWQVSGE